MEQVKKLVEAESAKKGRPLTCFINTFGCQMNARDSEKLLGILKEAGYEEGTMRIQISSSTIHAPFVRTRT